MQTPLARVHGVAQPPQCARSFCVSTQAGFPEQSVAPVSHAQRPAKHVPSPQACRQAPQCAESAERSLQSFPHASWPAGQSWQRLAVQVWVAPHALPQVPQLSWSSSSVWQPKPQSACPAGHLEQEQPATPSPSPATTKRQMTALLRKPAIEAMEYPSLNCSCAAPMTGSTHSEPRPPPRRASDGAASPVFRPAVGVEVDAGW